MITDNRWVQITLISEKYTFAPGTLESILYISVTVWWFLWATIRNSFQFAFSSEAESGSPIFSAPLLKDFERFLLCFISNIAGHHLIERCKRMKAMLSFFMGVRCGDLTQDPSDSQRQVRNMSIDEVWPDNKTPQFIYWLLYELLTNPFTNAATAIFLYFIHSNTLSVPNFRLF